MKWNNAVRDSLPLSSRKVLISHKGVYHVAIFNSHTQEFLVNDETGSKVLKASNDQVYWTELAVHNHLSKRDFFRILIAEDDIDDQKMMKEALAECKVEVRIDTVFDGVQVMDFLLKRGPYSKIDYLPDLLLLDLNLPLKDGFSVLKEIKKHRNLQELPIYVITTSRSADHMSKALDLGASGFYTKGSKSEDILNVVKELCRECFEESVI